MLNNTLSLAQVVVGLASGPLVQHVLGGDIGAFFVTTGALGAAMLLLVCLIDITCEWIPLLVDGES